MTETLLGKPIHSISILAAAYKTASYQDARIYAVSSGETCLFYDIDLSRGVCERTFAMPGSAHCWGVAIGADGAVYATGDGYLYRYSPRDGTFESLGMPIAGENYFFKLRTAPDGRLYGGTYPNGKVYEYDPATKRFRDFGQMAPGQSYVRGLALHEGNLYIGVGVQTAQVIEYDMVTGAKRDLALPAHFADDKFIYDVDVAYPLLFVRTGASQRLAVYDLREDRWVREWDGANGWDVLADPRGTSVYAIKDKTMHVYDTAAGELRATGFHVGEPANGLGWIGEDADGRFAGCVIGIRRGGGIWIYNPVTGEATEVRIALTEQPTKIRALTCGPDGAICIGGYFAGGFARYEPADGSMAEYKGISQIDGFAVSDERIYIGAYPYANLFAYEPGAAWEYGRNPRLLFSLAEHRQDRPFELAMAGKELAVGTYPEYGRLGGALSLYDPDSGKLEVYDQLIDRQCIVALAYRDGVLYGGTSVWGSLGLKPEAAEAVLFAWDTAERRLLWQTVPVPGERAVASLAFDGEGTLWGVTGGLLFRFDAAMRRTTDVRRLFAYDWDDITHFVHTSRLELDPSGRYLVGVLNNTLFRYELATGAVTTHMEGVAYLALDRAGNAYSARAEKLYRYTFGSE